MTHMVLKGHMEDTIAVSIEVDVNVSIGNTNIWDGKKETKPTISEALLHSFWHSLQVCVALLAESTRIDTERSWMHTFTMWKIVRSTISNCILLNKGTPNEEMAVSALLYSLPGSLTISACPIVPIMLSLTSIK